jgi:hypothetical protein
LIEAKDEIADSNDIVPAPSSGPLPPSLFGLPLSHPPSDLISVDDPLHAGLNVNDPEDSWGQVHDTIQLQQIRVVVAPHVHAIPMPDDTHVPCPYPLSPKSGLSPLLP